MALEVKTNTNGRLIVVGYFEGVRVRKSTHLPDSPENRAKANQTMIDVQQEILLKNGDLTNKSDILQVKTMIDAYLSYKKQENKWSHQMEKLCDDFRNYWGSQVADDITTSTTQNMVQELWEDIKPGSVRKYLNIWVAILNHASTVWKYHPPKVKKPRVYDERDMHFEPKEANDFLEWVKSEEPSYYPHFLTLIDTGVRLGELLKLKKRDFKDTTLTVRKNQIRHGKAKTREIPLSDDLKILVENFVAPINDPTRPVFLSKDFKEWTGTNSASATLNKVLRRGCDAIHYLPVIEEGEETHLRVHDLRHTFAYLTAKAGADLGDLQYLMGHSDVSQTMRYRGFIQSRARDFVGQRNNSDLMSFTSFV